MVVFSKEGKKNRKEERTDVKGNSFLCKKNMYKIFISIKEG